ncbi:hypothetical protein CLV30_1336 [Haloactinopolyspora alba]|uniref:Four-helix bundle copper-binding protein n=1 Tax=Haloactinopolyspora alba TaxID=648780 RepID=A0A2P8D3S2_9ACTN|nr:four-helix bundle copper-binding protein [Haloactinopolyspora alba]PSK91873.1 hypothetical protein CLV30_1336 [Haloactinopolyspora alba]
MSGVGTVPAGERSRVVAMQNAGKPTIISMIDSFPADIMTDRTLLAEAVTACLECVQACTGCADACLAGMNHHPRHALASCVTTNLDCADTCAATARVLSRHASCDTSIARVQLRASAQACHSCAEECQRHADVLDCCRICAEVCFRCKEACDRVLAALG